jgi:protein-S-isoprenylcysteine O-methyltransferase Ste14
MSRWGIGPPFTLLSLLYSAVVMAVDRALVPSSRMIFVPAPAAVYGGIVLIAAGMVLYVVSLVALHRAYSAGSLLTDGVYAYVRHPIYGSFIVLIVPGIALALRSLPGLTIPIFMYLVFRALIGAEENHLRMTFGERYEAYHRRVGAVFPRIR